jgi:transcriptional regulator with XRE-family HTH domain
MTSAEVRAFRGRYGLTQLAMARVVGLPDSDRYVIGRIEKGRARFTEEQEKRLMVWADDNGWRLHCDQEPVRA